VHLNGRCIQTFAENLRWNPHVHILLLSGMVNQAGEFLPLGHWDLPVLTDLPPRGVQPIPAPL
jgi:hypothetical protein